MQKPIIIITGPTASGKTGLAIDIANILKGEIINADSLQIYKENPIISAQPTINERKNIPHHLFGYIMGSENYNIVKWINDAINVINNIKSTPIIVGGTGFFLKHLIFGLSNIPDVSQNTKEEAATLLNKIGNYKFYHLLKEIDPKSAEKIDPHNTKRLLRAYEVYKETGKTINSWENSYFFPINRFKMIIIEPDREKLYKNCNQRFLDMLEIGALDEVRHLIAKNYNPIMGVMKSHGIPELSKYISGEWNLNQAIEKSQQVVRNYAKRQITWNKHQYSSLELKKLVISDPRAEFYSALEFCKNY